MDAHVDVFVVHDAGQGRYNFLACLLCSQYPVAVIDAISSREQSKIFFEITMAEDVGAAPQSKWFSISHEPSLPMFYSVASEKPPSAYLGD
jgi:hypothetical protein